MEITLQGDGWLDKDGVLARVNSAKMKPLAKCAFLVEAEWKRLLSKGATTVVTGGGRDGKGHFLKKHVTYQSGPPGEPPRLRTGNARASIQSAPKDETYIVGPTQQAWYLRMSEFGGEIVVSEKAHWYLGLTLGIWVPIGATIRIPKRPSGGPALANMAAKFPEQFKGMI